MRVGKLNNSICIAVAIAVVVL